jgi:hypothetical protein
MKRISLTLTTWFGILTLVFFTTASQFALAQTTSKRPINPLSAPHNADIFQQLQSSTIVLMKLDFERIQLPKLNNVDQNRDIDSQQELAGVLQENLDQLKSTFGPGPLYTVVDFPFSPSQPMIRIFGEQSEDKSEEIVNMMSRFGYPVAKKEHSWLVVSFGKGALDLINPLVTQVNRSYDVYEVGNTPGSLPISKDRFEKGFQNIESYPIQLVIVPPDYLWRTYEELLDELPSELGGGPVSKLTQGFRWMAIGIDPKTMSMSAIVQSATADAAKEFAPIVPSLVSQVVASLPSNIQKKVELIMTELGSRVQSETVEDQIRFAIKPSTDPEQVVREFRELAIKLLMPLFDQEIRPILRTVVLAIHNFESAHSCLPPAATHRDQTGQSGLSWRVHILPFMDELELYNQFKLDEPWDSPHNKSLLPKIPNVYRNGNFLLNRRNRLIPEGYTTVVAPVGEGTIFGGTEVVTFGKITDGTSNTIMFVEVKPELAVPWTAPQDYSFDPENPAAGLKVGENGKFTAALADGSTTEISADLSPESIKHLFQMNDGNVVILK